MTTALERIGETIRAMRIERELTQTEVATRSGLAQTRISEIEGGKINVTIETLQKIAHALGCTLTVELVPRAKRKT